MRTLQYGQAQHRPYDVAQATVAIMRGDIAREGRVAQVEVIGFNERSFSLFEG